MRLEKTSLINHTAGQVRPRVSERYSSTNSVHRNPQMRNKDENMRAGPRGPSTGSRDHGRGQNIFLSPDKSENRRPRRNSESSVANKRPIIDEERKRRERRRREGETTNGSKKGREPPSSRTKKPRGLDLIDKLDVTGIYGPGCKFNLKFIFYVITLTNAKPPFIMMVRSTLVIHIGIERKITVRQCMRFQ